MNYSELKHIKKWIAKEDYSNFIKKGSIGEIREEWLHLESGDSFVFPWRWSGHNPWVPYYEFKDYYEAIL